jgi:hypothetical protein
MSSPLSGIRQNSHQSAFGYSPMSPQSGTILADLFTPLLFTDLSFAVRASLSS